MLASKTCQTAMLHSSFFPFVDNHNTRSAPSRKKTPVRQHGCLSACNRLYYNRRERTRICRIIGTRVWCSARPRLHDDTTKRCFVALVVERYSSASTEAYQFSNITLLLLFWNVIKLQILFSCNSLRRRLFLVTLNEWLPKRRNFNLIIFWRILITSDSYLP